MRLVAILVPCLFLAGCARRETPLPRTVEFDGGIRLVFEGEDRILTLHTNVRPRYPSRNEIQGPARDYTLTVTVVSNIFFSFHASAKGIDFGSWRYASSLDSLSAWGPCYVTIDGTRVDIVDAWEQFGKEDHRFVLRSLPAVDAFKEDESHRNAFPDAPSRDRREEQYPVAKQDYPYVVKMTHFLGAAGTGFVYYVSETSIVVVGWDDFGSPQKEMLNRALTKSETKKLNDCLRLLQIDTLKDEYVNPGMLDGFRQSFTFDINGKKKKIFVSNRYVPELSYLCATINELVPENLRSGARFLPKK